MALVTVDGPVSSLRQLWGQRLRSLLSEMCSIFGTSPVGFRFHCCRHRNRPLSHAFVVAPGVKASRREAR